MMIQDLSPEERKNLQSLRDVEQHEVDFLRGKVWSIFSWANTLLFGGIGGLVLFREKISNVIGTQPVRYTLTIAIVTLAGYAIGWLYLTNRKQDTKRYRVRKLDELLGLYEHADLLRTNNRAEDIQSAEDIQKERHYHSHSVVVGVLAVVSVILVWL
jgi:hypothetical protein